MKLVLKNFRCFTNLTLDLPSKGLVLLWGNSGVGKSSILKAINFVLYGKEQKVVTLGEKKCSVCMSLDEEEAGDRWQITRTKGPTHLVLQTEEGKFEDDVAQQMIYSRFGEHFFLTNYIAQKSVNSFFGLSNTEKTAFLHRLTIQQFDIDSFKGKIKNKIKDRRLALAGITSEVSTYRTLLEEETKGGVLNEPVFPLRLTQQRECIEDSIIATLQEEAERREKNDCKLKKDIEKESELLVQQTKFEQSRPLLVQLQELLARKREELHREKETIPPEVNLEEWYTSKREIDERLKNLKGIEEHLRAKEVFDTKRADLIESLEERVSALEKDIEPLPSYDSNKILSLQQTLRSVQQRNRVLKQSNDWLSSVEEDFTELCNVESVSNSLKEYLESYEEELLDFDTTEDNKRKNTIEVTELELKNKIRDLETQLKGQRLCCPGCKINVLLRQNSLVPFDTVKAEKEKSELGTKLVKCQKELSNMGLVIQQKEENKKEVLKDIQTVKSLLSAVDEVKGVQVDTSEKEIQQEINDITSVIERKKTLVKDLSSLQQQLKQVDQHPSLVKLAPKALSSVLTQLLKTKGYSLELVHNDIEQTLKEIGNLQSKIKEAEETKRKREEGLRKISAIQKEIESSEAQKGIYETYSSREKELEDVHESILSRKQKAEKFEKRLRSVESYQQAKEKYDRQERIRQQLLHAQHREKLAQRGLSKAEELIECVQQAENITLENCLTQINAEVDDYMSRFFEETDFQMSLFSYRENKDGDKKACIDIRIQRDGEQYGIDSLSGGEFDRACLALFLAFNKVANREMLMLDECLSSLHSEAVEDIIETVKEKYRNRLVLMTLHQANTGLFDRVVDVSQYRE